MWRAVLKVIWPYVIGVGLLLGVWLWHLAQLREARQEGYKEARAESALEAERAREHQREIDEEVQREHQAKVGEIERRVTRLLRRGDAIRLCEPANEVRTDSGEPTGSAGDGSAVRAGRDIGPELVRFGERAEKLRQQIIAIKQRQP
jgi:hypothetical protein